MSQYRDVYTYMEFPWISKTTYKTFKQCRWKFLKYVIEGIARDTNTVMQMGTALHLLFYRFFEEIDWDYLNTLEWWDGVHSTGSPVYRYFLSVCYKITGDTKSSHIITNIENFCMFEENHFVDISENEKDKRKAKRLFIPSVSEREFFLKDEKFMLYGTIDRKFVEKDKIIIADYKTGNVPKSVREDDREGPYSGASMSHYAVEGNFYIMLYLLRNGYTFERRPRKKDGNLQWEMVDRDGKVCSKLISKRYDYAFIFTGAHEDEPITYVARKKGNMVSIRAILDNVESIRKCNDWYREPNIKRCYWCDLYATECEGKIPFEIHRNVR